VVTLPDQIDMANARQVTEQLAAALAPGVSAVIAYMPATTYCDTSAAAQWCKATSKPPRTRSAWGC
jgi:hypothetical protein